MKPINFIVIKLSLALTLGILCGKFLPDNYFLLLKLLPIGFMFLFFTWLWERKKLIRLPAFGILTYVVFFLLGYGNYQLQLPAFQKNHYAQYIKKTNTIQLKISETLKPSSFHDKYLAEVSQVGKTKTEGRVLLNIQKDSITKTLNVYNELIIHSKINPVSPPLNPYQFNYKSYLENLGVYGEITLSTSSILKRKKGSSTLNGVSESIRNHLSERLKESPFEKDELAIVQALTMGQKKELSKKLKQQYTDAGAIHILAISGLHVGILFILLNGLLKPLIYLKWGKPMKLIITVLLLWMFAIMVGLSPSVVRSVTMFSFFAFAEVINRKTHGINTLALSFFTLLILQPKWLFHVGFQMSYLAVFFILWIQPLLFKLYHPRFYIDKLLWGITTVSIAAQLGVAPLSIYYFHQFPGIFLITNIVVLPLLAIILSVGLLVIMLAAFNILPNWIANTYNYIIGLLNNFMSWAASQNALLFKDISLSISETLAIYLIIISTIVVIQKRSYKTFGLAFTAITIFILVHISEIKKTIGEELILFHKSKKTLLGYKKDNGFIIFQNDTINYSNSYPLKEYKIAQRIKTFSHEGIPITFQYKSKKVLVLDSLGIYPNKDIDILILTQSPKINLNRLIDSMQPSLILADGSNYRSYVQRWKLTCSHRNIKFHSTRTNGYFKIK